MLCEVRITPRAVVFVATAAAIYGLDDIHLQYDSGQMTAANACWSLSPDPSPGRTPGLLLECSLSLRDRIGLQYSSHYLSYDFMTG